MAEGGVVAAARRGCAHLLSREEERLPHRRCDRGVELLVVQRVARLHQLDAAHLPPGVSGGVRGYITVRSGWVGDTTVGGGSGEGVDSTPLTFHDGGGKPRERSRLRCCSASASSVGGKRSSAPPILSGIRSRRSMTCMGRGKAGLRLHGMAGRRCVWGSRRGCAWRVAYGAWRYGAPAAPPRRWALRRAAAGFPRAAPSPRAAAAARRRALPGAAPAAAAPAEERV